MTALSDLFEKYILNQFNFFGKTEEIQQEKPQVIEEETSCNKYKKRIEEIPDYIPLNELDNIIGQFDKIHLITAYRQLKNIATTNGNHLKMDTRRRIDRLLEKPESINQYYRTSGLSEQSLTNGFEIRIVQPNELSDDLLYDLASIGVCWNDHSKVDEDHAKTRAELLQRETNIGNCVQLIGERNKTPHGPIGYVRNYIAKTGSDEQILFLDTIESGDKTWNSTEQWIEKERGKELLYYFAATIYIAKALDLKKIGFGENESDIIATALNLNEETLFNKSQPYRKIGIQGSPHPHIHRLEGSSKRRTLSLDQITAPSLKELNTSLERVGTFIYEQKDRIAKNYSKIEEVQMYLKAIGELNEKLYKDKFLSSTIEGVKKNVPKFKLNEYELELAKGFQT